jgi:hypothetical protein
VCTWVADFCNRWGFSLRTISKYGMKTRSEDELRASLTTFLLDCRVLQLQGNNDPDYGFCNLLLVGNHDSVPIEMRAKSTKSVADKGSLTVIDSTTAGNSLVLVSRLLNCLVFTEHSLYAHLDADKNRFATLHYGLVGLKKPPPPELWSKLMAKLKELYPNHVGPIVPPVLIFRATNFTRGEDWTGKAADKITFERDLWDDRVRVCFQENAWCDSRAYNYILEFQWGPFNQVLLALGFRGVLFRDGLSSYTTDASTEAEQKWAPAMDHVTGPAELTSDTQAVDRHQGKPAKVQYCTADSFAIAINNCRSVCSVLNSTP